MHDLTTLLLRAFAEPPALQAGAAATPGARP
jgi:hypothetical protein